MRYLLGLLGPAVVALSPDTSCAPPVGHSSPWGTEGGTRRPWHCASTAQQPLITSALSTLFGSPVSNTAPYRLLQRKQPSHYTSERAHVFKQTKLLFYCMAELSEGHRSAKCSGTLLHREVVGWSTACLDREPPESAVGVSFCASP